MVPAAVEARRTRHRPMVALFTGAAVTHVSMVGASTVSTLVGAQLLSPLWSGIPNAAGIVGSAVGTLTLAAVLARRGSRAALVLGYLVAVIGAVVAGGAVLADAAGPLMVGMLLLGVGNGAAQLSRYCAADLYPPDRKGFAVGVVVWAGTVGALAGPNLIAPLARFSTGLGLPPLAGPYFLALVGAGAAVAASATLPTTRAGTRRGDPGPGAVSAGVWRRPVVRTAVVSMTAGQVSMVAVMTMTPLHMDMHGHGLGAVGAVVSAHLLGMFLLAPLSGHIVDRFGARTAILAGIGLIALSTMVALVPAAASAQLYVALFLLGSGWNLTFVGGSGLLAQSLTLADRQHVQGGVDAVAWGASAVASVGAGMVLGTVGYPVLAVSAGAAVLLPLFLLARADVPAAVPSSGRAEDPPDRRGGQPCC
ncbi:MULTISPECIES: MFS transporter [unclassified Solwaraspora]|uniref:MFS transporter n=1 Tax=unclassified Solwaraspora TaxID=2627926 RepID=UPI00248AB342|nr:MULTISPECIES: MFS transporter [unclassified Solwaraspora]WBB99346.1 MFS transporter [Solwaraspora sp. WMMA2059]WBC22104.1 MFS transporter [Solwaraspora sp. WMMA2080]WJK35852.1 MFS transporter [Solwaraspora sp. WMMA2065]